MNLNREQARELAVLCALRHGWSQEFQSDTQNSDGSWSFWVDETPPKGENARRCVLVHADKREPEAYGLFGEIGRRYWEKSSELGLPRSDERWLGSGPGKYQLFDKGIVAWDGFTGEARTRFCNWPEYLHGRQVQSMVAFFDLRGFTQWTANLDKKSSEIQNVLEMIESEIQRAIRTELRIDHRRFVFLKGTGDGFMIVLEYPDNPYEGDKFADQFFKACRAVIEGSIQTALPQELSLGCGIDCGHLTQVFLLGQLDYLGKAVNNAAKLQQLAWNEICVSEEFYRRLDASTVSKPNSWRRLGKRGYRYALEAN